MRASTGLKALASATLIGLVLWWVGPRALAQSFAQLPPGRLFWICLLAALFLLGRSFKWQIVARSEDPRLGFGGSAKSLIAGMGFGMITPGRAGEFTRAMFMERGDRVSLVGLFTVDRVLDLLTIILIGSAASLLVGHAWIALGGLGIGVAGLAVLASLRLLGPFVHRLARFVRLERYAERFVDGAMRIGPRRMVAAIAASVLSTSVGYFQFWIILSTFVEIPIVASAFAFTAMILSNLLPISIAGLGVREWVSVLLLREFDVPEAVAVNAAFLSYLVNTVLPGIAGALLITSQRGKSRAAEANV